MNVNYQLEKEQKLTQDHVCVLASLFLYVCGLSLFPSPSRWWSCGLAFPCWSLHGQSFISSWCLNTTMCCFVFVAIMVVLSVFPDCCCLEAFHEYFLFSLFLEPSSWSLVNAFIHWLGCSCTSKSPVRDADMYNLRADCKYYKIKLTLGISNISVVLFW